MTSSHVECVRAWLHEDFAIPDLVTVAPIAAGTNNRSFLVITDRASYVLKRYRNVGIDARLPFEHALLTALAGAGLPFAVPTPVPTQSGETSPTIHHDGEAWRIALFSTIAGRAAEFGNVEEAERCGAALAILDQTLAAIQLVPSVVLPETFGALSAVHDLVPDPRAAIRQLFGSGVRSSTLLDIMGRAEAGWEGHTGGWSLQLIHSDFYPSNTLIDAGKVAGVLDFEYAGKGYRAMDFAIGLAAFSTRRWENGPVWSALVAFAQGYLTHVPLTAEETRAVPALWLMREVTSFIHFLGRMEQSLTTRNDIEDRARRLLALHRWVTDHQGQLVERLGQIALHE